MELIKDVRFWEAVAAFAWPITVVFVALLFRKLLISLLSRDQFKFKVAGMEITVAEATEQVGKGLTDLQERVAALENAATNGLGANPDLPLTTNENTQRARALLWVDDYPSNNAFIIEKLENEGIRVRKELSTDAAMAALGVDNFDLVITDLGRVEGGKENAFAGLELTRAMRAASFDLPLLVFAGQRGLENKDRLEAAGADYVTASPVEVFKFVDQYLRLGR